MYSVGIPYAGVKGGEGKKDAFRFTTCTNCVRRAVVNQSREKGASKCHINLRYAHCTLLNNEQ